MHSALFVATPTPKRTDWQTFVERIARVVTPANGALRLAENVWLVDTSASMFAFATLVRDAEALGLSYGIVPFESEPRWLPVGFDPKTIRVPTES